MNTQLTELYKSKDFSLFIKKLTEGHELWEDLHSEVFVALYETKPEIIEQLIAQNKLKFYAVRIAINMWRSTTSRFYKQYRKLSEHSVSLDNFDTIDEDEAVNGDLGFLDLVDSYKHLFTEAEVRAAYLYCSLGTYRSVAAEMNIPQRTIGTKIKKVKDTLKKEVAKCQ